MHVLILRVISKCLEPVLASGSCAAAWPAWREAHGAACDGKPSQSPLIGVVLKGGFNTRFRRSAFIHCVPSHGKYAAEDIQSYEPLWAIVRTNRSVGGCNSDGNQISPRLAAGFEGTGMNSASGEIDRGPRQKATYRLRGFRVSGWVFSLFRCLAWEHQDRHLASLRREQHENG